MKADKTPPTINADRLDTKRVPYKVPEGPKLDLRGSGTLNAPKPAETFPDRARSRGGK